MYVCVGRKYTSPSTFLLQLVIMVDHLEKVGEGPYTRSLHVDWERLSFEIENLSQQYSKLVIIVHLDLGIFFEGNRVVS